MLDDADLKQPLHVFVHNYLPSCTVYFDHLDSARIQDSWFYTHMSMCLAEHAFYSLIFCGICEPSVRRVQ